MSYMNNSFYTVQCKNVSDEDVGVAYVDVDTAVYIPSCLHISNI